MPLHVSTVTVYEDLFPPDRKPPAIVNYSGPKLLEQRDPHYAVDLDSGAFRALWELLESEAKHRFPTHQSMTSARALLRAVEAFRESYWNQNEPPAPPPAKANGKRQTRRRRFTDAG